MPYTQESAMNQAGIVKTAYAVSKLHLFVSTFMPSVSSVLADFEAAEATYDGYTAGGAPIAAFNGPIMDPAGGADLISPLVYFAFVKGANNTQNMIGGWFLVDTNGLLICYGVYSTPIPMAMNGNAIPQTVTLNFGGNPLPVSAG